MIKIWNEAFLKKQPQNEYDTEAVQKLHFLDVLPSVNWVLQAY